MDRAVAKAILPALAKALNADELPSFYQDVYKRQEDQLDDYARRRGMPIGDMRKFLATTI